MAPEDMIQPGTQPPDGGAQTGNMATTLDSRYTQTSGRVFLNGTQALVRLMLDQARRDAAAGLSTGAWPAAIADHRSPPLIRNYGVQTAILTRMPSNSSRQ